MMMMKMMEILVSNALLSDYLLTYSMVQGPSWAADWLAASQEIPRISRNPKVHYRTHKRPPYFLINTSKSILFWLQKKKPFWASLSDSAKAETVLV